MYFSKHPRNKTDPDLLSLSEEERILLVSKGKKADPTGRIEGRIYDFNIALPSINFYRRY